MSKVKEYGYPVQVQCRLCGKKHTLLVNRDDWDVFNNPKGKRPLVQQIFPYLSPNERELLISGTCDECWAKMFPPDDDEDFDTE